MPGVYFNRWGRFRAFLLLFRRDAHDRTGPGGLSFLDAALTEGRRYEQRITAALSSRSCSAP